MVLLLLLWRLLVLLLGGLLLVLLLRGLAVRGMCVEGGVGGTIALLGRRHRNVASPRACNCCRGGTAAHLCVCACACVCVCVRIGTCVCARVCALFT